MDQKNARTSAFGQLNRAGCELRDGWDCLYPRCVWLDLFGYLLPHPTCVCRCLLAKLTDIKPRSTEPANRSASYSLNYPAMREKDAPTQKTQGQRRDDGTRLDAVEWRDVRLKLPYGRRGSINLSLAKPRKRSGVKLCQINHKNGLTGQISPLNLRCGATLPPSRPEGDDAASRPVSGSG